MLLPLDPESTVDLVKSCDCSLFLEGDLLRLHETVWSPSVHCMKTHHNKHALQLENVSFYSTTQNNEYTSIAAHVCTEASYSSGTGCVSGEGNGCRGRRLGPAKILRFCIFSHFLSSLKSHCKSPLPRFRPGWLLLSSTIWIITVGK